MGTIGECRLRELTMTTPERIKSMKKTGKRGEKEGNEDSLIPLERARLQLAKLWFIGSGLIVLILIAQSIFGKYQGEAQDVWSWALPTIVPTLSLIIAILGAGALEPINNEITVRQTFHTFAYWLSCAYLFVILATIGAEPFTAYEPLQLLNLSNLWLAPFQGLVTSAIGVLFFTKQ